MRRTAVFRFIEVNLSNRADPVERRLLEHLRPLFRHVTWLNLANCRISEQARPLLAELEHLTRLYLQKTNIKSSDLAHLKNLRYLECLNLYGTAVENEGLQHLSGLENLKTLYLWQTRVTEAGIENLKKQRPDVAVNGGISSSQAEKIEPATPPVLTAPSP